MSRGRTFAGPFVGVIFCVMVFVLVGFVARFGVDAPAQDDWRVVPYATGDMPVTLDWLFTPHGGHVIALPKFVGVMTLKFTGVRYPIVMLLNVALLALATLLVLKGIRHWRGQWSVIDATVPLILLNPGQIENVIWAFQLCFTLVGFLVALALWTTLRRRTPDARQNTWPMLLVGVCGVMLAFTSNAGLAYALCCATWVAVCGFMSTRRLDRAMGLSAAGLIGVAAGVSMWMVTTTPRTFPVELSNFTDLPRGVVAAMSGACGGMLMNLGGWWRGGATLLLCAAALSIALLQLRQRPTDRHALLGAALVIVGALGAATMIALGRGAFTPVAVTMSRYVTLISPALVGAYVVFAVLLDRRWSRLIGATIGVGMAVVIVAPGGAVGAAVRFAEARHDRLDLFVRDARAGHGDEYLASRHATWQVAEDNLRSTQQPFGMLRRARAGPFRDVTIVPEPLPAWARVDVPVNIVDSNDMTFPTPTIGRYGGVDPYLSFSLGASREVLAVEVTCRIVPRRAGEWSLFQFFWHDEGRNHAAPGERNVYMKISPDPEVRTFGVWVFDRINRFRIDPERLGGEIEILKLTVHVRDDGSTN